MAPQRSHSDGVSIVLCTYQQGAYIRDAIESVLAQSYPAIELLLIDNGSTDGTASIVSAYRGRPNVIVQAHETNGPVTQRLNAGIRASAGAYVGFLFGDDYYLPDKIARQMACFATLPDDYGVVYGPGYRLNVRTGERWLQRSYDGSGFIGHDLVRRFHSASLSPVAPLIRRRCLEQHPFHEDLFLEGTESVLLRIALTDKFQYLDEPLVVMREHPLNYGKAYRANTELNLVLLDRLAREPSFPRDLDRTVVRIKAQALRSLAWATLRIKADGQEARGYFRRAVAMEPSEAIQPRTILGWTLSLFPTPLLRLIDRIGTLMRRPKIGLEYREGHA